MLWNCFAEARPNKSLQLTLRLLRVWLIPFVHVTIRFELCSLRAGATEHCLLGGATMSAVSVFQPWCSRRLSVDELDLHLKPVIKLLQSLHGPRDDLVVSLTAFRQSAIHVNSIWLTTEPHVHRDFSEGTAILQAVQDSRVVAKCRLVSA
jgi:hypothetical protein